MKFRKIAVGLVCILGIMICAAMLAGRAVQSENEKEVEPMADFSIDSAAAGTIVDETAVDKGKLETYFVYREITEEVFQRINGRSYQEGGGIALEDLRYLKVLHYNFSHEIQAGEMIVSAQLADDLCSIFRELFEEEYEIESMRLIDDYWTGDGTTSDEASVAANNSSAFCYRVIAGTDILSRHAYGCAVDINPKQNPYVVYANGIPGGYPECSQEFVERQHGEPHMITEEDVCYRVFKAHGFTWGGDWENPKDYQHFEQQQ